MGYRYNPFTGELDRVDTTGQPAENRFPITPYVVGPSGQAGYQTIQSAIDAATASSESSNVIWIQPGSYTENLNITSSITFMSIDGVAAITGVHTPPSSGAVTFDGCLLISPTDILNSSAAWTTVFNINNSFIIITDGYIFNLPNWTGEILMDNCGEASTEDGVINNVTGGSTIKLINVEMGSGSKTMELNGDPAGFLRFDTCNVNCPVNMSGSGEVLFQNGVRFGNTVTIGGSLEGFALETCWHDTNGDPLSTAAIVYNSSGNFILTDGSINTTNDPAIDGTGSGTLTLAGIDFSNSSTISSSLTVNGGTTYSGIFKSDYTDHAVLLGQGTTEDIVPTNVGTDGQLLIGGTAIDPAFASLTSTGGTVTFTPGPNSLNLEASGSVAITFDTDSGSATPAANTINFVGDATQGISSSGAGDTVTYTIADATTSQKGVSELATDAEAIAGADNSRTIVPSSLAAKLGTQTSDGIPYGAGTAAALGWTAGLTDGQLVIGSTAGTPAAASLASADSSITITPGSNTIDLATGSAVAVSFTTDSGTATPSSGIVNIAGGTLLNTSGATNVVTVNADDNVVGSVVSDSGTATPASNAFTLTGSGGITTSASGSTVTIDGSGEQVITITSLDNTDSPYTVLSSDYYMSCDVSGGTLTIDLPDAPTTGKVYIVKDAGGDANTNNITVTTSGGIVTIDGATARVISTDYAALQFVFNGTSYEVF